MEGREVVGVQEIQDERRKPEGGREGGREVHAMHCTIISSTHTGTGTFSTCTCTVHVPLLVLMLLVLHVPGRRAKGS